MRSTTQMYHQQGYVVIPQVIEPEIAKQLSQSVLSDLCQMAFSKEKRRIDPYAPETLALFLDPKLRAKRLRDPSCIWEDGNPRRPILTKDTGMLNLCFNPDVLKHVHYQPKVYAEIAELYGSPRLAYLHGPDRVGIKIKGSEDMPLHLDYHLFQRFFEPGIDGRFEKRVQAFVCGQIPHDVPLESSGTLALVPYFHHYFDLARVYFDPHTGLFPLPQKRSPFHILGSSFLKGLHSFNTFIQEYTPMYRAFEEGVPLEEIQGPPAALAVLKEHLIPVPTEEIYPLQLTPIDCQAGDLVCFDQRLPHQNLKNTSKTARIVFYLRLFEVPYGWYGSREHQQLLEKQKQGQNAASQHHENALERRTFGRDGNFSHEDPQVMELYRKLNTLEPWESFVTP
ncbi:MAG: hypothetical protein H6727_18675 [Myxococcales bacterium]|nr:hypothetical protein [Myxococcales bacterium]